MNDRRNFFRADKLGLALCTVVWERYTGCIGYASSVRAGSKARDAWAGVQATIASEDDYVYYPNYECWFTA